LLSARPEQQKGEYSFGRLSALEEKIQEGDVRMNDSACAMEREIERERERERESPK